MAYGVNVLTGEVVSVPNAEVGTKSAGVLSNDANAIITSGFNALTGEIKTVAAAVSAGTLSNNANVVLS